MRILVVDDEPQIVRVLRAALQSNDYEIFTASNGAEALQVYLEVNPALVITDLAMPEMDGVALTREIRQRASTPVIVVSVRNQEREKIRALDEGADDYITKPFAIQELLARVRVQLRRASERESEVDYARPFITAGDFEINTERHIVRLRGEEIRLTPKEFDLLLQFARNPERVLTHKTLLKAIWGPAGIDQQESLRVLVGQLRKKIERGPGTPQYIQTEPWIGYRFVPVAQ
ncbi:MULTISPECIES: response regulator transcription factor [Acidobacterium]|uniref:Two-component osmotic transcriptional regulator kdpE, winged helix family n=1 Tax=Acidobacterium capsulatum (strain ATCC 51196 / DSM 11244 / BCRC 80197 / JCM 7670 / NBRC 15755 / NCIMB 13165 / 161) TaxID=240015 RepID=C1FA44_ACIC5|nr:MULTISPECIES: response regulator transcription factor [Acidobacterium]ACO34355.1 two-component osmotic transcriptional regulator kdpE, winged helix family [Acidobacterium capsulatum ATCC 51196]HCT62030.1 DNA-binding response regulator [Acidobacterium sp.]